jgi:hypothetical protein
METILGELKNQPFEAPSSLAAEGPWQRSGNQYPSQHGQNDQM